MPLTANANGEIAGQFVIPANVTAGSKLVQFEGEATNAVATFVGRGVLKTEELRLINTTVNRRILTWNGDPLAQTFILDRQKQIAAVDLWFAAKGPSKVLIQIRGVELGIPTADVIAESILYPSNISTNSFTRFKFPPVVLEAGVEYAIVAACDDAQAALYVGELGKFDDASNKWVTSQPYQVGVLLSSSNNRTWTAHQDKDLTFRLLAANYSVSTNTTVAGSTTNIVNLTPVNVTNADNLIVMAAVDRPTPETDAYFEVTVGSTVYTLSEGLPLTLPSRYSGPITWRAVLKGTYEDSPRLYPDVHLVVGTRRATGNYISRAMLRNGGNKVTIYYDAVKPGTSTVTVDVESGANSGTWVAAPVVGGTELGDNWQEIKHEITGFTFDDLRVRLNLAGSSANRPIVRNLRVLIT